MEKGTGKGDRFIYWETVRSWPTDVYHDGQKPTQSSRNPAFESWLEGIDPVRPKSCLVFLAYVVERLCASHFRLDSAYACPAIPAGIA